MRSAIRAYHGSPENLDRFDDSLILRLADAADSPSLSPRADQYRRISAKIDDAYSKGSPLAENWDARFTRWEENLEDALHGIEGDEAWRAGNVDDTATGVSPWFAARYAEYAADPLRYDAKKDMVQNLRAVAEDGTGSYPTPRQPLDQDVFEMARQIFEDREALRQRYRHPAKLRTIDLDSLIDRLR